VSAGDEGAILLVVKTPHPRMIGGGTAAQ
jgi:hypothetical protein